MIAALLLALAPPLYAEATEAVVSRVLRRVDQLVAAQMGKDTAEIASLDRQAASLSRELKPLGWKAVAVLAAAARDIKRPAKVRLHAVAFLGLTQDPAAFPPLEDILLNREQAPFVRSLAAQSLPGLDIPDAAVSRALCGALVQEDLPREVLAEVLIPLKRLGCQDPSARKILHEQRD